MPTDIYDLIDQPAAAPAGDEYAQVLDGQRGVERQALQESMTVASTVEPDRRAKVIALANRTSLPLDVVDRQFDRLTIEEKRRSTDYDRMIDETPKLAKWLGNPDNASVASDDLETLGRVEKTVREHGALSQMYSALGAGLSKISANVARVPALIYDAAALPQNLLAKAVGRPDLQVRAAEWAIDNPIAEFYDRQAKGFQAQAPALDKSVSDQISRGQYADAGRTLAIQFAANAPQQAALILASLTGVGGAGLAVAGATTAADANKEARESGADPAAATTNALTQGAIEASFESLGTFSLLKHWENAIARQYGKEVSKEVFKDFGKTMVHSVAGEANEEAWTSIAQDLSSYITGVNPDALTGAGQRALDAGIAGGFSGGVMTGPSAIGAGVNRGAQIRKAALDRDFYLALGPGLEASKLRSRMPEKQRELINDLVKDSPVENVYIPLAAAEVYFQSKNVNPVKSMQDLGVLTQYEEAKAAGTDIEIPLATWAEKVVGTEHYQGLANDIKFNPEDLTVNEAQALRDQTSKSLEAEDQAAAAAAPAEESSGPAVGDAIFEQLRGAGFDDSTASRYAKVYESTFQNLGQRAGVDPMELFSQYGLQVARTDEVPGVPRQAETALNQSSDRPLQTAVPLPETVAVVDADVARVPGELFAANAPKEQKRPIQDAAKQFVYDNFQGKVFQNGHTGWDIEVSRTGIKHAFGKAAGPGNILALTNIDKLLQNSVLLRSEPDRKGRDGNIKAVHSLYSQLKAGERNFLVRLVVRETKDGRKFYDQAVIEKEMPADKPLGEAAPQPSVKDGEHPSSLNIGEFLESVKSAQREDPFFQGADSPRGLIRFGADRQFRIDLLKNADLSTFLHETGHFYMELLGDLAALETAPQQLKDDYQTVLKWLGVESRDQITRDHHEQWARGFEHYLAEGKAPSNDLREAFARFKVWLLQIYRDLRNLDVELNSDIRDVMARMLATDEQIAAAYDRQNIKPAFPDARAAGMSEAQAERYERARDEARRFAEEQVTVKLMADHRRQQAAWWKEKRAAISAEFESQANGMRIFRAMSILQKGEMSDGSPLPAGTQAIKLSKEDLVRDFGADILKRLPRPYVYAREGGVHHSLAAELLGFETGEALVTELANTEKKSDWVARMTDEEMAARYPDLLTDGNLPDEAIRAVHNEKRDEMLRLELEHMASQNLPALKDVIRRIGRRIPPDKTIREQAEKQIGKKTVRDLKPHLYRAAEVRAAKEAADAVARGDFAAAFEAKSRERLNSALFRAATDAKQAVEDAVASFKKLNRADADLAKSRDTDLVNAARAVLAKFALGRPGKPASEYLTQIEQYDPELFATVDAMVRSATENAKDYREISFDDFVDLKNTIDAMWELAKTSKQMVIDGQVRDRQEIQGELEARLVDLTKETATAGITRAVSERDKVIRTLLGARSSLRRVESWATSLDGGESGGPFMKYFVNPVMAATTAFRLDKKAKLQAFLDIIKPIRGDLVKREISAPELGYTFSGKAEILGALLHTGNSSNLEKLLLGRGWGARDATGVLDRGRWDGFILRLTQNGTLTKADFDTVQKIWDLFEEMKPAAQRTHKRLYGHYFSEITANEFETPFGTYRGGYAPAITDSFVVSDANMRNEKEALEKTNNSFMFPSAGRGFTKSRVQQYQAPLMMDLNLVPMHIDKVMRFVHIEPVVRDLGRIVMNKGFRKVLEGFDPTAAGDMLVPWLQRAARQSATTPSQGWGGKAVDRFFSTVRKRTGMQIMILNVTNALQNFSGLSLAAVVVKPASLRSSLWSYVRSPKAVSDEVAEKSDFMKTRIGEQAIDLQKQIDDIVLNPTKFDQLRDATLKHGSFLQVATQNVMEVVTWSAAYNDAVERGLDETEAVKAADSVVRQTQGAMNPEDVSKFEAGSAFVRAFSMFYSYFNMHANLLGSQFAIAMREMGLKRGAGRLMYIYAFGVMIPAVINELLMRTMAGAGLDEDDDEEYLDDVMAMFFGGQARSFTAMVPVAGPIAQGMLNQVNDKWGDDRLSVSPAVNAVESAAGNVSNFYKAIEGKNVSPKKAVRDALTLVGMMTGLPTGPLARPIGYLTDVESGKAKPSGPVDFARGVVTGKPGAQ